MISAYAAFTTQNRLQNRTPERARQRSAVLFERVYLRGVFRRFGWRLTRKSRSLLSLQAVRKDFHVDERHYAGLQFVPIALIQGSEGRNQDFDRAFAPCNEHTRDRWIQIAAARKQHASLPPVELIRVGAVYFVRDGHHRISVARARGETFIEAEVIEWVLPSIDAASHHSAH